MCLALPHAPGMTHRGEQTQPPSSLKKPFPALLAQCLFPWPREAVHWSRPIPAHSSPDALHHNLLLLLVLGLSCSLQRDTRFHTCAHANTHRYLPPSGSHELLHSLSLQCHGWSLLLRPFLLTNSSPHSLGKSTLPAPPPQPDSEWPPLLSSCDLVQISSCLLFLQVDLLDDGTTETENPFEKSRVPMRGASRSPGGCWPSW